jgi:hypothetical protein
MEAGKFSLLIEKHRHSIEGHGGRQAASLPKFITMWKKTF